MFGGERLKSSCSAFT